ncbi:hypothetical protein [Novosphingobium sp. TCA1]|uniref:hypothetical protein n=1 Tax=Novosphingobium sp. TCA1 TaxID=2682474 RepID=UPI00130D3B8B|nr:hypothetical protein [Novosphingobium sp. TCA1]GFE76750.1 hypothetical protein NTCA1_43990 [Novosphingobium sp. TCA1]
MYDLDRLKKSSKKIRNIVRDNGVDIKLSQCHNFIAQMAGFDSYYSLYINYTKSGLNLHRRSPDEAAIRRFISDFQLDVSPETFSNLVQPSGSTQSYDEPLRGVAGDDWM